MKFRVTNGDYVVDMERPSAEQAAIDAIGLIKLKTCKPRLSKITTVESEGKTVYLSTTFLIGQNGI